jgi:hypothetical protein
VTDYQSGFELAGYRIESVIGRGGMAVVYRAEDTRLGRKVALKVLTPVLAHNEQFQQRFIRESRLAASLDHPNIVPIYEAGEADGQLFIAMRYVAGSDLKVLLSQQGGLPLARMLRIFVQIGDALDAAHELGLVHRDVKPGNILVASSQEHSGHGYSDHVYLTDFGLTKRTTSLSGALTGTGHFLGTVDYVSPEQIQGAPVGPSTDIYALGCVLYECLTGQLPFHRDDDAALLWAHLVEAPPPVSGVRPDLPAAVDDVVARAMAKAPEDRYASCHELVRDLELALDVAVQLPGATRTGRRAGPSHGRFPDDVSADHGLAGGPSVVGGSTGDAGTGAEPASSAAGSSAWASHPSFPPGVMEPLPAGGRPGEVGTGDGGTDAAGPPEPDVDYAGPDGQDRAYVSGEDEQDRAYGSAEDEQGDAGAGAGWDDEDAYAQEFDSDEELAAAAAAAAAESASARHRRRRWMLIGGAAVAVVLLAVGAALFLLPSRTTAESFQTYANPGSIIPYTLSRPQSWTAQEGAASDAILSPRPDAVGDTFFLSASGSGQRWDGTRKLLASSPGSAVGLYVYASEAKSDTTTDALQRAIAVNAAGPISWDPAHWQRKVAGSPADELEGVMVDPADPNVRLKVDFYVVQPAGGGTVLLAFFAPPEEMDAQQATFDRVLASLRLS